MFVPLLWFGSLYGGPVPGDEAAKVVTAKAGAQTNQNDRVQIFLIGNFANTDCVYSDTTLNPRGAVISHSGTKYFPEA